MSNTPSKAEIEKLAAEHIKAFAQFSGAGDVWVEGEVAFARAVLAKWGTPQQEAQEPALFVSAKQLASLADPSHATAGSYLPARKTRAGLFTMALYTAPQPVVREPLTDAQIAEMMRDTWGCASIAPRHALEFARAVERAHGITQKGGS